jgi:hypothetical protein
MYQITSGSRRGEEICGILKSMSLRKEEDSSNDRLIRRIAREALPDLPVDVGFGCSVVVGSMLGVVLHMYMGGIGEPSKRKRFNRGT